MEDAVLGGLDFAFRNLDDILIFSLTLEIKLQHLKMVLWHLLEGGLMLKEIKYNVLKKHL